MGKIIEKLILEANLDELRELRKDFAEGGALATTAEDILLGYLGNLRQDLHELKIVSQNIAITIFSKIDDIVNHLKGVVAVGQESYNNETYVE
ncbi:hypothetical protein R1flu_011412 [Riccia fluitans]|uniref:Uncharacterized protein n=1 Tax=Riccia fluitans TaxID=41844 RepID=A0ABD1Z7Z1_9MARC